MTYTMKTTAVTAARRSRRNHTAALLLSVACWMDPIRPFILFCVSVSAYSVHQDHHQQQQPYASRSRRYFTGEVLLPPLERLDSAESFHHQRRQCHDPNNNDAGLETIYTNDPAQVSQWLANHVPSTGCTLGFDLEVCLLYAYNSWIGSSWACFVSLSVDEL